MRSHEYELTLREWLTSILPTLTVLLGLAVTLNGSHWLGLLSDPPAGLDPANTVIAHQVRAAHSASAARVVLLGDSTCMMGIDAPTLASCLPRRLAVINLGLIIWYDLPVYGEVLAAFAAANPGQIEAVVLLVTPRKLTFKSGEHERGDWRQIAEAEHRRQATHLSAGPLKNALGVNLLRQRLLSHVLATPLGGRGEATAHFGFASEVDAYLTAHGGSFLEFGRLKPGPRQKEWTRAPAPDLAEQSLAFRKWLPPGAKLYVGLTPVPSSHISPEELRQRAALLSQWGAWIRADSVLTNLPATMPGVYFGAGGHTNPEGQRRLTILLGRELAALLRDKE